MVERLYYVTGIDLFKSTLQTASMMGWGHAVMTGYEPEENLIKIEHKINRNFNRQLYLIFLEGVYRGIIKRVFNKGIRYIRFTRIDQSTETGSESKGEIYVYEIKIRLKRNSEAEI